MNRNLPDWVIFPEENWVNISPAEAGLDPHRFEAWLRTLGFHGADFGGEDHTGGKWGVMLSRGGYCLHTWGDPHYRFQTASMGKAFMWVLLGYAVDDGLLDIDAPIHHTWTGEDELSHPHKYLNQGHHKSLTWRHIIGTQFGRTHQGGFPMEIGSAYAAGREGLSLEEADKVCPAWANWTGDPYYDLYTHVPPGTQEHYSSAGFWRMGQALTHVWDRDLKDVLDERLFSKIGIAPDSWEWYIGKDVQSQQYFYPTIPDSYTYLDPPYRVNGHAVRSGPGWAVMCAADIARFGHLLATRGMWQSEQLIDPQWLRGHGGGNRSGVSGENTHYTALAQVTTEGVNHVHASARESFVPAELFTGPVQVRG
jgi:CubicO group peptidase (beta-lactamase class C family)